MTSDEQGGQKPKRKLAKRQKTEATQVIDIAETFDVANAKEKDFDLDLDAAKFQGKKGQAGTRTKMGGGDPNNRTVTGSGQAQATRADAQSGSAWG